ncbi:THAP domain-containing protein 2-like [Saccostrea echinata]|uniref:THAP domain-containing protein 2-like n=1 Tax=Saccostrea echinata TaxID=191078 RepID=UPI002A80C43F|nr:THAP domain-containing protein 2-like [Saccostrea echinata]
MESNENTPTCELTISKRDEYCCVPLCNGNARIHHDLSFHHIPKKLEMRKKWLVAIRRDEGPQFKIGNNTVVCSRHFNESNFRSTLVRKCLKADAVPSVFPWTQNAPPRKPPRERHHLPQSRKFSENFQNGQPCRMQVKSGRTSGNNTEKE